MTDSENRKPGEVQDDKVADALAGIQDRLRSVIVRGFGGVNARLAHQCSIGAPRITDWLRPKKPDKPDADKLIRLSLGSDVSLDWLLLGEGGDDPVYRSQKRTDRALADDMTAHVCRVLASEGTPGHAVGHLLPAPDALLKLAVEAAKQALAAERAAAAGRYRATVARLVADRGLPDGVRALAFLFADAADDPSVRLERLEPLEWGGVPLAAAELLPDVPAADMCEVELVTVRAELDKGHHNFQLSTARPTVVPYRMNRTEEAATPAGVARRYRASTDAHEALELRQLEEEVSRAYRLDRIVKWSAGQRWVRTPDPHHDGFTRWHWAGPMDSSGPATE